MKEEGDLPCYFTPEQLRRSLQDLLEQDPSFRTVAYFLWKWALKLPYPHMQGAGDSGR